MASFAYRRGEWARVKKHTCYSFSFDGKKLKGNIKFMQKCFHHDLKVLLHDEQLMRTEGFPLGENKGNTTDTAAAEGFSPRLLFVIYWQAALM